MITIVIFKSEYSARNPSYTEDKALCQLQCVLPWFHMDSAKMDGRIQIFLQNVPQQILHETPKTESYTNKWTYVYLFY